MKDKVYFKHDKLVGMGNFSIAIRNGYEISSPAEYDLNEKDKEIMKKLEKQYGVEAYISNEAATGYFRKRLSGDQKGYEWFKAFKNVLKAATSLNNERNRTVVLSLRIDQNLKNKMQSTKDYVNKVTKVLEKEFMS